MPAAGISLAEDVYGPFSGQVTSAVRQAMRRAVLEAHVRLVEAMFLCEVSSTAEVLSGALNATAVLERSHPRSLQTSGPSEDWRGLLCCALPLGFPCADDMLTGGVHGARLEAVVTTRERCDTYSRCA